MDLDVYKDWLGIPEGPRPPDHYQLLRLVQFEDDAGKIRNNYKKLNAHVRKYAGGKFSDRSQELLNELAKAMLCLTDGERKLDYDRGLGREVEEDADLLGRKPCEVVLWEQKHITREQMEQAREFVERTGLDMRDAVVQLKLVDQATATQALALELGRPYVDLTEMLPDDSVLDKVSRALVKRHTILPLFIDDGQLLVATAHDLSHELEEELRLRFGVPIRAVMATPLSINQAIAKYYAPGMRNEALAAAPASGKGISGAAASAASAAATMKRYSELSPDEQQTRTQLGIVILCWCIIIPILLDQFVLSRYYPNLMVPYVGLLVLLIPPPVIFWVLRIYWRK